MNIGFVGLGNMGSGMANNLLNSSNALPSNLFPETSVWRICTRNDRLLPRHMHKTRMNFKAQFCLFHTDYVLLVEEIKC